VCSDGQTRTTNSDGSRDVLGRAGSADHGEHKRLAERCLTRRRRRTGGGVGAELGWTVGNEMVLAGDGAARRWLSGTPRKRRLVEDDGEAPGRSTEEGSEAMGAALLKVCSRWT
jgi:hypothetical protein